jgi:hypothetical protein
MPREIIKMQIRVTEPIRARAKEVARRHDLTLSELVLTLLAKTGDKELKQLIDKELKERPKPGRPWDK